MSMEYKEKQIVSDFPFNVKIVDHEWIMLKDGTRLAVRMWLPETDKPLPAVLEYIPYRKSDGTRMRDNPMHGFISGHGYVVLRVDMRGTGESDGLMYDEYLKQEQDDAVEVIDWISKQPWCDGNVGMMGKSWGGFNSLQVAALRPPALKAIIAVGFTDDRYNDDIHYKGGCLLNDNFWWGAIMLAYQSRPLDPNVVGEGWRDSWLKRLEEMPLWPANWMENQVRNEFWKHGSIGENYDDIKVPVLAMDGWADSYINPVFRVMEKLNVPRRVIMGPWAHVYAHDGTPAPAFGFLQEAVRWWDHWLKGIDNSVMDEPAILAWIENSMPPASERPFSDGFWVGLDGWPSADIKNKVYSLADGKLADDGQGQDAAVVLKTPLNHGLLAGEWMGAGVPGESPPDQRIDNGMSMVFDSVALKEPFEILGYPVFEVELSSDKPQAMLFASLLDIAPDGSANRISYGVMNLTHLQGHDKVVHLKPGEKVKAKVMLDCCGHKFAAGHKVRLSLATSYWPMFWPMPEDAALTLDLKSAKFTLPNFVGRPCNAPGLPPQSAENTPVTWISEGRVDRAISYDILTDTWTCITDGIGGVFGEGIYRFDDIDVTVEHNLKRDLRLCNQDPLSAKYTITQNMRLGREGWWTNADISITKTSDIDNFYIACEMTVTENEKAVFTKQWDYKVRRNGL